MAKQTTDETVVKEQDKIVIQNMVSVSPGWHVNGKYLELPPVQRAPKNLLLVDPADFEVIKELPSYRDMKDKKQIRVLDRVPNSYYASSELVAQANARVKDAKAEADSHKATIASKDAEIEALKKKLADVGGAKE